MEQICSDCMTPEMDEGMAEGRPSASFIYAVSALLDTDPADLLSELGYYDRQATEELIQSR